MAKETKNKETEVIETKSKLEIFKSAGSMMLVALGIALGTFIVLGLILLFLDILMG